MSGIDANTLLMLHMDDTGLTDSSDSGHTMTLQANATRSDTESKFGGYSAYFDGAVDGLTCPDSTDFTAADADFTLDFWIKRVGNLTRQFVYGQSNSGALESTIGVMCEIDSSNHILGGLTVGSTINYVDGGVIDTAWHHIALERDSDVFTIYVDGVAQDTYDATGDTVNDSSNLLAIGRLGEFTGLTFNGYIDELRYSNVARYQANFTPETSAYSAVADTIVTLAEAFSVICSLSGTPVAPIVILTLTEAFSITSSLSATLKIGIPLASPLSIQTTMSAEIGWRVYAEPFSVITSMSIGMINMIWRELLDRDSRITMVLEENSPITKTLERDSLISDLTENSILGT
jgi:concanavalin A-like lectin/glucanase superfamily protein